MAKDPWDKLDTVGKIVSSILLVVIAMVIKNGSERIAFSLQSGQLVQSLITDLTTANQQTRQDVALLALDNSIGDERPQMVAAIAERLFRDTQDRDSTNTHALGSIAYKVLQHRDSERASQISAQLDSLIAQSRATLVSNPDTAVIAQQQAPADAQLVTRVFSNVVYIQFMHENERQLASQLRAELNAADMHAPGIELKQGNYKNWVRYFHADDRALAETVAAQAARLASKPGHPVTFRVQDLSAKSFRAPRGQVEVWINLAAPALVIPSRPG